MERRKFIAGLGSLTAAGAAGIGTGAFSTANVDRAISVNIAQDNNAYLGLDPSTCEYASIQSSGEMALEFDGSNGQNGSGLNDNANTKFHNVFRIVNNGTNAFNLLATGLDASTSDGDGVDPVAIYYTNDKQENHTPTYDNYGGSDHDLLWGSPNPLEGAGSWAPSGQGYIKLNPGDDAYIHMEFFLKDDSDYPVSVKDSIPTELSLSAQGADNF